MSFLRQVLVGVSLLAATISHAADEFVVPALSGRVVDEVGLYSPEERAMLSSILEDLEKKSTIQMAVLVPKSLQGYAIEDYSIRVVEAWKLGKAKEDTGILFILAPAEKKLRLEIGYGLEGDIPDSRAMQILSERVRPYLKENRVFDGTASAILAVAKIKGVTLSVGGNVRDEPREPRRGKGSHPGLLLIGIILFILIARVSPLGALFLFSGGGGGRRGGWGGGGGGGFSGGGGGFGGGGASSDW